MFASTKTRIRDFLYGIVDEANRDQATAQKSHPATKVALRQLFNFYQAQVRAGNRFALADTGFRLFSQFEEDGLLLYLFAAIGVERHRFVDIGSADGINSNCANLAVNFGWHGLFIEGEPGKVARGRAYYAKHPDTFVYPPTFVQAIVQRENVNELIRGAGVSGVVDLLSIDIDGNDYWVWEALDAIAPRVVIVETNVAFGRRSIVVPYEKNLFAAGIPASCLGASPVAMAKLAARKSYRLVGACRYGINLIFVRNGVAEDVVPAVSVDTVFDHPRMAERERFFETIKDRQYETV